ncbi:hypothetical protein M569_11381, partial [Genlisea aurea]
STWLAKAYLKKIREDLKMNHATFRNILSSSLNIEVAKYTTYRARKAALNLIHGHHMEQFDRIYNYCAEVKRKNPDVKCVLRLRPTFWACNEMARKQFQILYFSFGACRDGFLEACRPYLSWD